MGEPRDVGGAAPTNWLNEAALIWGRPPGMPQLTAEDGRTIIRLLHEVIETKREGNKNDA